MTCAIGAILLGTVAGIVGALGTLLWLAAHEDADRHTTPEEWPSRRREPRA